MIKIYKDDIIKFNQFDLREDKDIFQTILDERKDEIDSKRFFLNYLPQEIADSYDFNNLDSLRKFRYDCLKFDSPLQEMGGCNLTEENLENGFEYSGIKISDPNGKILGSFTINEGKIIYSPMFPHFYKERDIVKYAHDKYFTTMTFEEIMTIQIDLATELYVHIDDYRNFKDIIKNGKNGKYIFEKVNKDQMLEYVSKPENGEKILKKYLNVK